MGFGKYFWFSISINNSRNDLSKREIYERKLGRVLDQLDLNEGEQEYYGQFKDLSEMDLFDMGLSPRIFYKLEVIGKQLLREKSRLESKLSSFDDKV